MKLRNLIFVVIAIVGLFFIVSSGVSANASVQHNGLPNAIKGKIFSNYSSVTHAERANKKLMKEHRPSNCLILDARYNKYVKSSNVMDFIAMNAGRNTVIATNYHKKGNTYYIEAHKVFGINKPTETIKLTRYKHGYKITSYGHITKCAYQISKIPRL